MGLGRTTERLQFLLELDEKGVVKSFEKVGDTAERELKKAQTGLDKAGGQMTKFGAGAAAASGVALAALTGTASKFSQLGVEVGKFHDTTGLSLQSSSRLIEVTADMGIEVGTAEAAVNKMNVTASKTPAIFDKYNVTIAKTKDGNVDVEATLGNVIDRLDSITDPAAKAEAATALLGRGWKGMSELIAGGSAQLKQSMGDVADAKVFDDDKLQKAKDYRADMDALHDSIEELVLSIGQGAAPVIGALSAGIGGLISAVGAADSVTGGLVGTLLTIASVGIGAVGALSAIAGQVIKVRSRFVELGADGTKSLTTTGKAAVGLGAALGVAAAGFALYDLSQMNAKANAKGFTDALTNVTRITDEQAAKDIPLLIAAWESFMHLSPEKIATKIATENLAAAIRVRDMAVANDELRGTLEEQGITVAMLTGAIDVETAAQKSAADAAAKAQAATEDQTGAVEGAVGANNLATGSFERMGLAVGESNKQLAAGKATTDAYSLAYASLLGLLDEEDAWANVTKSIGAAFAGLQTGTQSVADQEQALRDAKRELGGYVDKLDGIPPELKTQIIAEISGSDLAELERIDRLVASLQKNKNVSITMTVNPGGLPGHATGTTNAENAFIAGENGPELIIGRQGATVYTAQQTQAMLAGGSSGSAAPSTPAASSGPKKSFEQTAGIWEAEQRAIAATQSVAADAETDEITIARRKWERGEMSMAQFRQMLVEHHAGLKEYTDAEDQALKEIQDLDAKKAAADKAQSDAEAAAAQTKRAADDEAAQHAMELADAKAKWEFDTNQISLDQYVAYLAGRVAMFEPFSAAWISRMTEMINLQAKADGDAKKSADDAAAQSKKKTDAIFDQAKANADLAKAASAVDDAMATERAANLDEWNTAKDKKSTADARSSAHQKSVDAKARTVDALIRGADARANAEGLTDDTPEWAKFVRVEIEKFMGQNPAYNDGLNAYLANLPKFHSGGVVQGTPGQETPIMAMPGERVIKNGQGGNVYITATINADGLNEAQAGALINRELRKLAQTIKAGQR